MFEKEAEERAKSYSFTIYLSDKRVRKSGKQIAIENYLAGAALGYKKGKEEAKDLLNEFMRIGAACDEDFEHDYSELIDEAEQFLKEEL